MRTTKSRRGNQILAAASGAAASILLGGNAFGAITMDTDGSGVPYVLIPGAGWSSTQAARLVVTNDGYVAAQTTGAGAELHIMSTGLKKLTNVVSGDSQHSLTQTWASPQDLYNGSVPGNTTITGGSTFNSGIARPTADNTIFSWYGGSTPDIYQTQWQTSSLTPTYGIQQATRSGLTVAPMAVQYKATGTSLGDAGLHKSDLEYVGPSGSNFQMLGAHGVTGGAFNTGGIQKMEWSRGTAGSSITAGTLNGSEGGFLVNASNSKSVLLDDLVSGVADNIMGMALNPVDNKLYFVSVSGTGNDGSNIFSDNKVYLSAVSFTFGTLAADSTATYVDLNGVAAGNSLEITWKKPLQADGANGNFGSLLTVNDLAFSPNGNSLYVSNGADRVFMFTVPEPTGLALLAPGALMALRRKKRN